MTSSSFTYSARNLIDLSKESEEEEEENQWEMAAYAAVVSVMQIIDQIQRHPRPPISLHKEQTESLTNVVTFLQDFLEGYNPHVTYTTEEDPLESRIAEAAYAAEDVIESYIVDQIHARHNNAPGNISSDEFYQDLQKVIEEMDLIKMKVGEIKEKQGVHIKKVAVKSDAGSFRSTSTAPKVGMIGFEDVLYQMLDKVTGGQADLQIIPIVGMGGIGKTTLARSIYIDPLVQEYFDVRAWSTISQEYNAQEILKQVIDQVDDKDKQNRKMLNEYEIGELLYKYLIGRRYLIVMDDMWSINAWDSVRRWFPNNDKGSRVVVTTRLSNLASQFNESNMEFPILNDKYIGKTCKYGYTQVVDPKASAASGMAKYGGLSKLHLQERKIKISANGTQHDEIIKVEHHWFPHNTFCSGAAFVAKRGGVDEDDGWIVTYVHNEDKNTSQMHIVDAKNFSKEPVAIIELPSRVPYGFHGAFMPF